MAWPLPMELSARSPPAPPSRGSLFKPNRCGHLLPGPLQRCTRSLLRLLPRASAPPNHPLRGSSWSCWPSCLYHPGLSGMKGFPLQLSLFVMALGQLVSAAGRNRFTFETCSKVGESAGRPSSTPARSTLMLAEDLRSTREITHVCFISQAGVGTATSAAENRSSGEKEK